jgi:hypothetical protein
MARRSTWLVVAALVVIALAAAYDALRDEVPPRPAAAPATTSAATATGQAAPEEAATSPAEFGGVLYYTDGACELQAIGLPTREAEEAPNWDDCRFVLSPDGDRVSGAGSGWDPYSDPRIGRLFQSADGSIQVSSNLGPEGEPIRGAAPSWRPSGRLTYVSRGALREWPDGETVLSQNDLAVAVRAHPDVPDSGRVRGVDVEETAWLDEHRLVATLSVPVEDSVEHLVAVFEGRRLQWVEFAGSAALFDLRVSSGGRFFAVMAGSSFLLLDSERGRVPLPTLVGPEVHALTWSPDEQWVAAAAGSHVYVFRPGSDEWTARLNIVANDLAWRGSAAPPEIAEAGEARDWLGGLQVSGRLFVTEPGCRLRALRTPELLWEEEPDGVESPCRFTLDGVDTPLAEEVSVAPDGGLRATCRDGRLTVFGAQGHVADVREACAPAWMPDGTLTFLRDGELWRGLREPRRVISRRALRRMFGSEASLEEVAWLDDERVWAVVRMGPDRVGIAAMTPERLVYSPTFTATRIENLVVSASGMVAANTDRGVVFFDQGGRRALSFFGAKAVAWAPGTLIAAVAAQREILFVAPISREVVALPLAVEDLEWVVP